MSRSKAKRSIRGDKLFQKMQSEGISVHAGSMPGFAEEAPQAYKDVDSVVQVVADARIAQKVAHVRPIAVIKG
jgi:tRNA-splicing ligase RtcB